MIEAVRKNYIRPLNTMPYVRGKNKLASNFLDEDYPELVMNEYAPLSVIHSFIQSINFIL